MTLSGGPLANYDVTTRGHVLYQNPAQGSVKCRSCPLSFSALEVVEHGIPASAEEPCPGTEEGRRLIALEEAAKPAPITEPCIAVPEDWEGTDAEGIALAVAGAFAGITQERDATQARLERAVDLLSSLVAAMPETSWAGSNIAVDQAKEFMEAHRPTPSDTP